ncbi:hypothetical protein JHK82_048367 [Glycine max]|nr:hypothetical protein JHK82_048367 [Glycine max]
MGAVWDSTCHSTNSAEKRMKWIFGRLKSKRLPSIKAPLPSKGTTLSEAEQQQSNHALTVGIASTAVVEAILLLNKGYDGAVANVWSCGVILFELLAAEFGFSLTHHQKLAQEVRIAPLKEKDMKAYLGEHLQGTTTKGHEPEVTVVKKSGTSSGEGSSAEVTVVLQLSGQLKKKNERVVLEPKNLLPKKTYTEHTLGCTGYTDGEEVSAIENNKLQWRTTLGCRGYMHGEEESASKIGGV